MQYKQLLALAAIGASVATAAPINGDSEAIPFYSDEGRRDVDSEAIPFYSDEGKRDVDTEALPFYNGKREYIYDDSEAPTSDEGKRDVDTEANNGRK